MRRFVELPFEVKRLLAALHELDVHEEGDGEVCTEKCDGCVAHNAILDYCKMAGLDYDWSEMQKLSEQMYGILLVPNGRPSVSGDDGLERLDRCRGADSTDAGKETNEWQR